MKKLGKKLSINKCETVEPYCNLSKCNAKCNEPYVQYPASYYYGVYYSSSL